MWKLFSLALLATAAAIPSPNIDGFFSSLSIPNLKERPGFEKAIENIKKDCNEYGPKGAFKVLEQSAIHTGFKLATALSSAIEKDIKNREVSNYIAIACRTIKNPAVKEQFEIVNSNFKQCTNPKYRVFDSSPNKTIDIACENNGERIISFVKEGGKDCFSKQETNINNCIRDSYKMFDTTKDAKNELVDPEKICRYLKISKKCLTEQLKHCLSTTTANFVGEVLVYDYPICKKTAAA